MVRIQGMKRDVTPGFATALGAAGGAMQGAVGMRGELQRQDAQAQEMALQAEQAQMQRVEFGLATEKLRLGIENARVNMEREKKLRADARVANTASLRAMQRTEGFDALGPEVRAFHEEAIRLAADMEPEAGAKVVAAAGTMIAKADNDVRRQSMLRTVMGSVSTGYWKQAEGVLAEIAGIDLDGDGTEDVPTRKLSDIAEEWTKRLQDPTTDASEIEQEYRQLRRAVDGAIARQERRLKVYNVLQMQYDAIVGIGSTARAYGENVRLFIAGMYAGTLALLALALKLAVLLNQLLLACCALAFRQSRGFALEFFRRRLQSVANVDQVFFTTGKFLFQLGLRLLGRGGFAEDALGVHEAQFEFLRVCGKTQASGRGGQHSQRDVMTKRFH